MKKKMRNFLALVTMMVMCFSVTALAGTTGFVPGKFGELSISCCVTCYSNSGIGQTKGAPYGYKNVANIIIRDINGNSLGGNSVTSAYNVIAIATKTSSKNNVNSALSGHYVKDSDGNPAQPLFLQVNLTEYK